MIHRTSIKMAPAKVGGEAIELVPLEGKVIGICCLAREENKKTKFGVRKMTHAAIICEGSKEPLEGIMFQSYFQELELNTWYIGRVVHLSSGGTKQWVLSATGIAPKTVAALNAIVDSLPATIPTQTVVTDETK